MSALAPDSRVAPHGHIPALDGLRGMAVLLVVVHHFTRIEAASGIEGVFRKLAHVGWSGVDLFFVLSGFLITGILLDSKGSGRYFRTFYARRALRIFPLYYGVLAAALIAAPLLARVDAGAAHTFVTGQGWYWTYLLNIRLVLDPPWVGSPFSTTHFWSLAIEEQFYLVWPLVVLLVPRHRLKAVCVGLVVGVALVRIGLLAGGMPPRSVYFFTITRLDGLAAGAWLAAVAREPGGLARYADRFGLVVLASVAILLSAFVAEGGLYAMGYAMPLAGYTALAALYGTAVAHAVIAPSAGLRRLWHSAPLRTLGRYSYGIYVFHLPLRYALERAGLGLECWTTFAGSPLAGQLAYLAIGFGLSVALALLSWHLWEKHWLALKDRVPYGREAPAGARAPALTPAGAD